MNKDLYNIQPHESQITHAKSAKLSRMFQWDAVDTSPDVGRQNVLKTVEMAIRHNDTDGIATEFKVD